jgi:hypothetical protein
LQSKRYSDEPDRSFGKRVKAMAERETILAAAWAETLFVGDLSVRGPPGILAAEFGGRHR